MRLLAGGCMAGNQSYKSPTPGQWVALCHREACRSPRYKSVNQKSVFETRKKAECSVEDSESHPHDWSAVRFGVDQALLRHLQLTGKSDHMTPVLASQLNSES